MSYLITERNNLPWNQEYKELNRQYEVKPHFYFSYPKTFFKGLFRNVASHFLIFTTEVWTFIQETRRKISSKKFSLIFFWAKIRNNSVSWWVMTELIGPNFCVDFKITQKRFLSVIVHIVWAFLLILGLNELRISHQLYQAYCLNALIFPVFGA